MDKTDTINSLVENSILASPPDLLFKIINSLDSELSSYQIGEIIGHDQSVSAQVLKLSNSSFFGFKGEIKTLDRAINILGTKTVRNIAVTTLLFSHTNKMKLYNIDMLEFWLQTFLVADMTRELSQKAGLDGDEAYIAGLLHHIGKLILYAKHQDATDLFKTPHTTQDILEYETQTWGVDNIELTQVLLKKWNIPQEIVQAISELRTHMGESVLGKVVFLADIFGNIITDKYYKCDLTQADLNDLLSSTHISKEAFQKFSVEIPGIAERGRMIMKVLSKNKPVATFRRTQNLVTLITPLEYSLSRSLLTVLGFKVDIGTPKQLEALEQQNNQDNQASPATSSHSRDAIRKTDTHHRKPAGGTVVISRDTVKHKPAKPGLLDGILSLFINKKPEPQQHHHKVEQEELQPISWHPIVIFEQTDPVEVKRLNTERYLVYDGKHKLIEDVEPLPIFFSNINFPH